MLSRLGRVELRRRDSTRAIKASGERSVTVTCAVEALGGGRVSASSVAVLVGG